MTKEEIKSVSDALLIIKQLQKVCKKQRGKIKDLEYEFKMQKIQYTQPSAEENLRSFGNFIKGFKK